jgi:hypothetical protein
MMAILLNCEFYEGIKKNYIEAICEKFKYGVKAKFNKKAQNEIWAMMIFDVISAQ